MSRTANRALYWTPRILCILFAIFISLFALDVFSEGYTGRELAVALAMHMIPTAILLVVTILAWRWEWTGAVLFIGLGIFYIVWSWGKFSVAAPIVIGGIPIIVGVLFVLNWLKREELRTAA
jgi:hypothetical protein